MSQRVSTIDISSNKIRKERNKIKRKKGNGILPRISELRNRCPASMSHATIIRYRYLYVLPDLAGKLTRIVAR